MQVKKMTIKDVVKLYGDQVACLIPASNYDYDAFKKIPKNTELDAKITKPRRYSTHKYTWNLIKYAVENGINDRDCVIEGSDFVLKKEVIHSKYLENGCDWDETWRDILQTLFLPAEEKTDIDGKKIKVRGSIKYSKKDELEIYKYQKKVIGFFSYNLGMTYQEFQLASGGY